MSTQHATVARALRRKHAAPVTGPGWYVMGQYQSVAWFLRKSDAERECQRLNYRGGFPYRVQQADSQGRWK